MYKITSQSKDFITYCNKDKCISIPVELVEQIKKEGAILIGEKFRTAPSTVGE
jgi:hypothetical protein